MRLFHTKFGLSYWEVIKLIFYDKIGKKFNKCLCGGDVITNYHRVGDEVGWETACSRCGMLVDED